MPEVGPHPEGLKAKTGGIDPLPEDLGNADEASIVTTLWTISVTMWPQAGNETSLTSSAAIGWPMWVLWIVRSGRGPSRHSSRP